jgi:hypothetical protein
MKTPPTFGKCNHCNIFAEHFKHSSCEKKMPTNHQEFFYFFMRTNHQEIMDKYNK